MIAFTNLERRFQEFLARLRESRLIGLLVLLCLALMTSKAIVYGTEALNLWLCRQPVLFGLSEIDSDVYFLDSVLVGMAVIALWAALGRLLPAVIIPFSLLSALVFANSRKYLATYQELTLGDLNLLGEALGILPEAIRGAPVQFAAVFAAAAGILWLLVRSLRRPPLVPMPAAARIIALVLLSGITLSEIYAPALFAPLTRGKNVFSLKERRQNGFLFSLSKSSVPALTQPEGYSAERVAEALKISAGNTDRNTQEAWKDADGLPPDVIIYLGESVLDLEKRFPNLHFSKPPQPNLRAMLDGSNKSVISGIHVSPTFGGQTSSVEFEVLYGIPLAALPRNSIPFYTVIDRPQEALPRLFKAKGYEAIAIHNYKENFYQRSFAYPFIGFDRFISLKDMAARRLDGAKPPRIRSIDGHDAYMNGSDEWPSDEMLIVSILDELDRADKEGRSVFIHAVSVTSHGGYGKWTGEQRHHVQVSLPDGREAPAELEGLASSLNSADDALGALIDKIRQRRRPTVLLFFGDHMPWLSRGSYQTAGFDEENTDARDRYDVPWFILTNKNSAVYIYPHKISTFYLPALLLSVLGMDGGSYFGALRQKFLKEIPVFRPDLIQDGTGNWYSGSSDGALPPEIKSLTDALTILAYDRLRGKGISCSE